MRSKLLFPQSYREWEHSLEQVGVEGVVGSVMPGDYALDCQSNPDKLTEAATAVAKVALGDAFKGLYRQYTGNNDLGLHVDIAQDRPYGSSIPELALWSLQSGKVRWLLKDSGSRDIEAISDAIARVEEMTSGQKVGNGYVINPAFRAEFAQVIFDDYGVLAFPPGLQNDTSGIRHPAIHQVESLSPRTSVTIYGDHV